MIIGEIARQAEAIMPSLTLGLRRRFADAQNVLPPPEPPFNDARYIRRNVAKRGYALSHQRPLAAAFRAVCQELKPFQKRLVERFFFDGNL